MTERFTVITLYTIPADAADAFVETWATAPASMAAPGAQLHRAVSPETSYQLIDVAQWDTLEQAHTAVTERRPAQSVVAHSAVYRVVSVTPDTAPAGPSEPLTLINLFSFPARAADGFVAGWPDSTARLADAPGFRGTRLHRAVSPDSPYQIVNVAKWDSVELWQAALSGFRPQAEGRPAGPGGVTVQPAFYTVVR